MSYSIPRVFLELCDNIVDNKQHAFNHAVKHKCLCLAAFSMEIIHVLATYSHEIPQVRNRLIFFNLNFRLSLQLFRWRITKTLSVLYL